MRWTSSVAACIVLLLLAFGAAGAVAGETGWLIHGVVTDRYGDAVEGATVEVTGYEDGWLGQTVTDSFGFYSFYYPGAGQLARLEVNYQNHVERTPWVTTDAGVPVELNVTMADLPPSGYGELYGVISKSADGIEYASGVVFTGSGYYHLVDAAGHNQWSLHLPVGTYDVWAQHNSGEFTYFSLNYTVNVTSDTRLFLPLVIDFTRFQPLVAYPEPGENRVNGTVFQGDGTPLAGAAVELLRIERGEEVTVNTTTSGESGAFSFSGVMEYDAVAVYKVRAGYGQGFTAGNASSAPFDVYYHDRLGVPHEYNVEVNTGYMWQQAIFDPSGPLRFEGTVGAHIEIEGLDTGHTVPANFTLTPGTYGYRVWLDGYEEHQSTFVYTGEPCVVQADLQPMVGNVTIMVEPSWAGVSLDGVMLGNGEIRLINLPRGAHTISVTAEGYHPQVYNLTLASGAELELGFALEPYPGSMRVEAPSSAAVILDGVPLGYGVVEKLEVESGSHLLCVELDGYHPYERLVEVGPGEDVYISTIDLIPMPALSNEYVGYTLDNFLNGLGEIFGALLRSLGL